MTDTEVNFSCQNLYFCVVYMVIMQLSKFLSQAGYIQCFEKYLSHLVSFLYYFFKSISLVHEFWWISLTWLLQGNIYLLACNLPGNNNNNKLKSLQKRLQIMRVGGGVIRQTQIIN